MKTKTKILGALGALALLGLTPYHYENDEETGSFKIGALLWSLRKDVGEEKDTYTIYFLPFLNEAEEEPVQDEDKEEPLDPEEPEDPDVEEAADDDNFV